ncbi:MAG: PTS sugar transporter subunit IIA [Syntrophobacterales bacterium]|jgi:PTS system nitrogen regulatory IIA component|nr:PTS sugar transporter subunit IIA [Syntrophobacterales bacterium]
MTIEDVLLQQCVLSDLKGTTRKEVIFELVNTLKEANLVQDAEKTVSVVLEREKLGSTGIGDGVAIPHGKLKGIKNILCAFGRSKGGVDFDAIDHNPVHIIFLLIAPEDSASLHLQMLSRISKVLRDPSLRKSLVEADKGGNLYKKVVKGVENIHRRSATA